MDKHATEKPPAQSPRPETTHASLRPDPVHASLRAGVSAHAADRLKAVGLMCVAVTLFAGLDTSAKYLETRAGLPVMQIVWARFTGQFLLMLTLLSVLPARALFGTNKLKLEMVRSLLMVSTTACNFLALLYLRLDQTVTVVFLAPLVVALLAGPLLGEWVGWRRAVAIFVGFLGILIVVRPGLAGLHPAFLLAFGAMLAYALFMLLTRHLAAYDTPLVMLFYSVLLGAVGLAPFALWSWVWPATAANGCCSAGSACWAAPGTTSSSTPTGWRPPPRSRRFSICSF